MSAKITLYILIIGTITVLSYNSYLLLTDQTTILNLILVGLMYNIVPITFAAILAQGFKSKFGTKIQPNKHNWGIEKIPQPFQFLLILSLSTILAMGYYPGLILALVLHIYNFAIRSSYSTSPSLYRFINTTYILYVIGSLILIMAPATYRVFTGNDLPF